MTSAPLPENEEERIQKLEELGILDTLEEQAYDDLTHLAAQICGAPIALVSLVDKERQWFKSRYGLEARETPRDLAFCAHAILGDKLFIVEDAAKDERFHDNPLAMGAPHVRFYAGAPLVLQNNLRLGTLCVIDNKPRTLSPQQQEALEALARQVVSQFELRIKVKELEYLDQAKDEFLSMVSHELRTPLTSINGSLTLLNHQTDQLNAQMKQLVDIAYRNSGRLLAIVNDILDLAKIEAGKLELQPKPLELWTLLESAIELNKMYAEECGSRLVLFRSDNIIPVIVNADEQRLLQVMSNLISNAVKFTHKGDTIEISLSIRNNTARVSVTDHGTGIPLEQQKLLFQKFKQIGLHENDKLPGTGLGLNICKQLVELHLGKIGCKSIPNELTSFFFSLPILKQGY